MGKIVGIAEFKSNCTRLLRELAQNGESITIANRGKLVAELKPVTQESRAKTLLGSLKGSVTFAPDFDPAESVLDSNWEEVWEANNPADLYAKS